MTDLLPYHCIAVSGYCKDVQDLILKNYGSMNKPLHVVEVGVWLGATIIQLANAMPNSRFFAVDTFEGSPELMFSPQVEEIPNLYEQFIANLTHQKLLNRVQVYRLPSTKAAELMIYSSCDLVLIDANHSVKCVKEDCLAWWPILKPGGFLCGDDWRCPEVQEGVRQSGLPLQGEEGFWWGRK
jgi:predicted O-methyltransferase YrrM